MSNLNAHKSLIVIGKETSYGTTQTTPEKKFPDFFEYEFGVAQVSVQQKTQTLEPKVSMSYAGRKSPTVTLTGIMTDEHEIFLKAYFSKSSSNYAWQTDDNDYSYTIAQAFPSASDNLGSGVVATGCRLQNLTINRDGDYVRYNAVFRAKTIDDQVDMSGWTLTAITNTTYPVLTPFMWKDVTCSLLDTQALTNLNTFSLNLTNEFTDDDIAFQNSQTKTRDKVCSVSGELSFEWIYDTTADAQVYDNIFSQTLNTDNITLVNTNKSWAIATEGQYKDYKRPDKDNCLYVSSVTKELRGDNSLTAISISVS